MERIDTPPTVNLERAPVRVEQLDLVHRMAHGDEDSARQLVAAHGAALLRFVRRCMAGAIEDAEEVVQDTFVKAAQMGATFKGSSSVRTWLCALARIRVADFQRRGARHKRMPVGRILRLDAIAPEARSMLHAPQTPIDELVDRLDHARIVQALLDAMTPDQREVVTLRYVEGLSVHDIARITRRSAKAVERLLERAKEKPRREIVRWLGESAGALKPELPTP